MKRHSMLVLGLFVILSLLAGPAMKISAHSPEGHGVGQDPVDGPVDDGDQQHGHEEGHLPASSQNVALVSKLKLTNVAGGIADVAAFGNYAYLNAFSSECAGRPNAQGTGVHIVDVKDPANPVKVGFIPAHPNSYVGEGVHVMRISTPHFTGDVLLHNNETCDGTKFAPSGASLWDVTNPRSPQPLSLTFGDAAPSVARQTYHTTHSVQGFTLPDGRAFAVLQDNQDLKDVDIFEITNPRVPVMVSERGFEDWPEAQSPLANGDSVFHHDMQVKYINGNTYMLVSYWDAGQILLNIDNPANPIFVADSDFPSPDLAGFQIPEGNSHQSYWNSDGTYILSSDEDFSPFRTLFETTSGPNAGPYGAGEFGWTKKISEVYGDAGMTGRTVFGGSGCEEDVNNNGVSDRAEVPSAATSGADVVVFVRGTCFFSKKVESGQLAGYSKVIVGQSHAGTRNGLLPDAFICGSQGHVFTVTASAICIGHRATHLLFNDAAAYTGPDLVAGGDLPAIGTLGESIKARTAFDGWGYVRLHDAKTLKELAAYAVPESLNPAYATGFGNLTVHEVKTDPRPRVNLAYLSYYDAGLRVVKFGPSGIQEVGHYIAEGGNDFWGTFPIQLPANAKANGGAPYLLMSDRDSGLWIFRYTGE